MDRSLTQLVSFGFVVVTSFGGAPALAQWMPVQQAPQQAPTYDYAQPQWGPAPAPQPQWGPAPAPQPQWGPAPAPVQPQPIPQWGPVPAPQPPYGYAPSVPPASPPVPGPSAAELDEIREARRVAAMRPRLLIKSWSGFAGSSTTTFDGESQDSDMPTTYGSALQLDWPLHPLFAVGGMIGYRSWSNEILDDNDLGRCASVDLDAVATVRWVFSRTGTNLYGAIPFGVTLNFLDPDRVANSISVSSNVGFNAGIVGGIQVMFGRVFGVMVEMGYTYHYASSELSEGTASYDLDFGNGELVFDTGLVFAF